MLTDPGYLKYYIAILIWVVVLKVLFMMINRLAKNTLVLSGKFFPATILFSYIGLSIGIFIGSNGQLAVTITVLALLSFFCGTAALLLFNDKYNTIQNRKMATYSFVMIVLALSVGSVAGTDSRKIPGAVDTKIFFYHPDLKMGKNQPGIKKKETDITVFNRSK
ncbi:MAG: hypothetical protein V4539_19445 [Bacteroidota bacterium]